MCDYSMLDQMLCEGVIGCIFKLFYLIFVLSLFQPPDVGSEPVTPHEVRRSSDGSNTNQLADDATP